MTAERALAAVAALWAAGLALSLAVAEDRLTWAMEVAPAVLAWPILWATRRNLAFTAMVYGLIAAHGLILMLGGAYTYSRVPLGFWLQDAFGLARNPYDRIGHFAQGFVPAMIAREMLVRPIGVGGRFWVRLLAVCAALAVSASYELIEYAAALVLGEGAESFLGMQGDPWDTQADMATALLGALVALALLGRYHDGAMARLEAQAARSATVQASTTR